MSTSAEDTIRDALLLPPSERAALAERLLDSVTPHESADIDGAWVEEAERRLRAYESGTVQRVPASEVFRELLGRTRQK